jgi:hypothetical protein
MESMNIVITDYTISVGGGTITLNSVSSVDIAAIKRIFNITKNYEMHLLDNLKNTIGIASIASNVITLNSYGLAKLENADDLLIEVAVSESTPMRTQLAATPTIDIGDVTLLAGEAHVGQVGGHVANPTANFTRPADTTAYASGDLVANSTTAGSVVAMTLGVARVSAGSGMIRRCKLHKSGTGVTNSSFRVHLFKAAPSTVTNGDNGAFLPSGVADYVGAFDVAIGRAFTDGAAGFGIPVDGFDASFKLASGQDLFALIEARGAYTPISSEVFTVTLDVLQD